jgi:hypothetical protein
MDVKKKRPLALRLLEVADEGGLTVREAKRRKLSACDAFFLIQVLFEGDKSVLLTTSFDGESRAPMSVKGLYEMWVSMTGYVAAQLDGEDPEHRKMAVFLQAVLDKLNLDRNMKPVTEPSSSPE